MTGLPPVLVTGSAGFIGKRLCTRLRELGHRVRGIDVQGRGSECGDVRDERALAAAIPVGGRVFHLASVVGVARVIGSPRATWTTAVDGTANVCRIARERGARVLLASSSEVYGEGFGRRLRETTPLPQEYGDWPRASYPEAKRAAEAIVRNFVDEGDDGRIARLFNVSGPGQSSSGGMVLPTFVESTLRGAPVPVIGDGTDVRCFQHVDDAVDGLIALMEHRGACGRTVNLGGGEAIEIEHLARRVGAILDRAPRIVHVSSASRYGGPSTRCRARVPDTSLARELLGHRASRPLERIVTDLAQRALHAQATGGMHRCAESPVVPLR